MFEIVQSKHGVYITDVSIVTDAGSVKAACVIDTGLPITVLSSKYALALDVHEKDAVTVDIFRNNISCYKTTATVTVGDVAVENVEIHIAIDGSVDMSRLGTNVLNAFDISTVGNIYTMRLRKAIGNSTDRIRYWVSQYLKSFGMQEYTELVMHDMPDDYEGNEEAVQDMAIHILVANGKM